MSGIGALVAPTHAHACDLCAIYTATELGESRTGVRVGLAEQFTDYNTLQEGGHAVDNTAGERLHSFITQFLVGYNFSRRLGVLLNLPLIARDFRRQEANGIVNGDETGIGDMSLLGSVEAFSNVTESSVTRFTLLGGLKLPSGNSRRIREELAESQHGSGGGPYDGRPFRPLHAGGGGEVPSGIHGHDLALGSGSTDGILGAQLFWSWQRVFVASAVQYLLRTQGSFDYTYANDLIWNGGPGYYVLLGHSYSVRAQAVISGESKGNDTLNGVKGSDTAITALYVGPGFAFTWGTTLAAEVAADLPVVENNTSLQIVPDYRLRGGMTWRF